MRIEKLKYSLFIGLWLSVSAATAQKRSEPTVNWVKFEQLDSLQRQQSRPVFVFLHTSWCGYCQLFKRGTLRRPEVIEALNNNYYCVSFDAESRQSIMFLEHTFNFRPTGVKTGQNELASWLMEPYKENAYPGLVFLDPAFRPVTAVFSALPHKSFTELIQRITAVVK